MESMHRPDLMGLADLSPTGNFEAGSLASFVLTYTCGRFGLDESGAIRIVFRSANDQSALQTTNPKAPGYVTAEASNGASLEIEYEQRAHVRPWYKALTITALQYLSEGDRIVIRIGDRRGGSPGLRLQTFCEDHFEFRVLADPIATGQFTRLPTSPVVRIVPGPPASWKALLPSQRRPDEAFSLLIKAEDRWGNPSDQAEAMLQLSSGHKIRGMPASIVFPKGQFSQVISGLSVGCGADVTIDIASDGAHLGTTNPLRIRCDGLRRYWSDLHGQSEETIGTNSALRYFEFARDCAALDICAHQGNDFQITDGFWSDLNKITSGFNREGEFITLPGYEWSGNTGVGGDHNVWYRREGRPIFRSSHAMIDGTADCNTVCHSAVDLFDALRDEDVIVSAHCGGRYADVKYAHDSDKEPSVEVHSCWGTFEWLVRDALESGYRIGIVGGSDDHKGRPGASHPGSSKFGAYGGMTCHLMEELSRDALFDSFRSRHHYATSGARIWLDVTTNFDRPAELFLGNPENDRGGSRTVRSAIMGDIVAVDQDDVEITFEILGSAPIERVELRDGLDLMEVIRPYGAGELGRRIRVIWEGAETRGRGRNAIWDGAALLQGNRFERAQAINFWNAEKPLRVASGEVSWSSFTTGSFSGFDAVLAEPSAGSLHIKTASARLDIDVRDIGLGDRVVEAGGLEKRLRVFRLPDLNSYRHLVLRRRIPIRKAGDTRPYICVTQEDGHRAWSSPLYLFRNRQSPAQRGNARSES